MFCGIVEATGIVETEKMKNDCKLLSIKPQFPFDDVKIGDSIAINGVCLTVTEIQNDRFHFDAVPETLALTNLGALKVGSTVNLERSMKADGRIGGHCVQGHVDGVGEILSIQPDGAALLVTIKVAPALAKYIVKKGYITLDGMSITIVSVDKEQFTVTLIPHTQEVTIVKSYQVGAKVNIEVDILGKYVEKIIEVNRT